MKNLHMLLVVLIVGCNASGSGSSRPAEAPKASSTDNKSKQSAQQRVPAPAPKIEGDVFLTLDITELPNKKVSLLGTTNLPEGTNLMLSVEAKLKNGFLGQSKCLVLSDGTFESDAFGPSNGLLDGLYVADVTMPFARTQPDEVKEVIGDLGQNLKGPLTEKGMFGITVSQRKEFSIGAQPVEAQATRQKQIDEEITNLKLQTCEYLEQLLKFKDEPQFKHFGFGTAGPYNKWLREVQALSHAQPKGQHPIPFELRVAPGELLQLGMAFIKGESKYTRDILPEVKETIGYDAYLAAKNKPQAKPQEFRIWQDATGKFKIEALLIRVEKEIVWLRKRDGSEFTIPISKLSSQDVKFIEKHTAK